MTDGRIDESDWRRARVAALLLRRELPPAYRDEAQGIAGLALVRAAKDYRTDLGVPWEAWLAASVGRRIRDAAKARRAGERRDRDYGMRAGNRERDPAWTAMIRDEARDCLDRVERHARFGRVVRSLLVLICYDGLDCGEAGARLGLSRATAWTYLCWARKAVRTH